MQTIPAWDLSKLDEVFDPPPPEDIEETWGATAEAEQGLAATLSLLGAPPRPRVVNN